MNRDKFRNDVFERDSYKCVICGNPGQDAHHIIERRLFADGGYYLDNGATLCGEHHILAEETILSCDELRSRIGIQTILLPEHLYPDYSYDKWGNIILPNGNRLRGELFYDESVQKILKPILHRFVKYVKYPRTYHLPWSTRTKDDRIMSDTSCFEGKRVIVTIKMDGENTTMYTDYIHARSLDSDNHDSRNWVKNLHNKIGYNIPDEWRVCGENLYAKHSIHYQNLKNYFQVFSIWNEVNVCLSWDETLDYCQLLGLGHVPILYDGIWDEAKIKQLYNEKDLSGDDMEGYVVRVADEFFYGNFKISIAKFVRPNHIVDVVHNWKHTQIIKNYLTTVR